MFSADNNRFATFGVIAHLPGDVIDSVWLIIDHDLQGVLPLNNLLQFDLQNNHGKLTMRFSQEGNPTQIAVDLPFAYDDNFPPRVMAYDDGENQTILLPEEGHRENDAD